MVLETGMDRLSVRTCPEVVAFGIRAGAHTADLSSTGAHSAPAEFHAELLAASNAQTGVNLPLLAVS
jgi:hypothetical protein